MEELKFQIGKNGLTEGVIESLRLAFKNYKQVRISVLKNAMRDKAKVKEMAEEIVSKLEERYNYSYRVIGFTIIVWRLAKKNFPKTNRRFKSSLF